MTIEMKSVSMQTRGVGHLSAISFVANAGDIVAVTGGSAESRTSLLLALLGLVPVEAGWVSVDGEPVVAHTAPFFRSRMAYVPCDLDFVDTTVIDFVKYCFKLQANADCAFSLERVKDELRHLSVGAACLESKFSELDGSVAQRVVMAVSGMFGRGIFLLDSPTSFQDEDGRLAVLSYLCSPEMKSVAIVVATDDPAILSVCNKVVKLNEKKN